MKFRACAGDSLTLLMAICGLALIGTAWRVRLPRHVRRRGAAVRRPLEPSTNRIGPRPLPASRKQKAAAMRAKSAQRPPARSTIWSRVKSSQRRRLGPRKRLRVVRCPARSRPRRLPPVRRYRTKRCPEKRSAADPSGPHSTVPAASQRAENSSAADVTAALNPAHLVDAPIAANANGTAAITPPVSGEWLCGSSYV